jgi:hypothetical protein
MLLETRYGRFTCNVFTPPKSGSQTAMLWYSTTIYFHNRRFTLEIRLIVANMTNGHIFYILGYGVDVLGIVAQFQFGTGIYFLFRSSRETVRPIQLLVQ